jgi:hypothetical protein
MPKKPHTRFRNPFKDRSPVQRRRAADYILITLISFAVSVSGTRLFLELTGYPQLGSGELHIAHVLWGGLFLFVSALLPLIYVNDWIYSVSAFLAGFGVGLFIDEVGKFITQNNNYFYPSAAPIIYVLFLLTVLIFSQVRLIRKPTTRSEMYSILERFNEILDQDLSEEEYKDLLDALNDIILNHKEPEMIHLAESLKSFLLSGKTRKVPDDPWLIDRMRIIARTLESKWLTRRKLKTVILIGLLAWAIWAVFSPIGYFMLSKDPQQFQTFVDQLITNHLVRNASGLNFFEARVLLEGSMGVISFVSVFLLLIKKEKQALWLGIFDLIFTLTVVNLMVFYFDQFSTIVFAAIQFILLILLLRYQKKYLLPPKIIN